MFGGDSSPNSSQLKKNAVSVLVPQAESGMPGAPEPDNGPVAAGNEVINILRT